MENDINREEVVKVLNKMNGKEFVFYSVDDVIIKSDKSQSNAHNMLPVLRINKRGVCMCFDNLFVPPIIVRLLYVV